MKSNKFTFQWRIVNLHMFGGLHENELNSPKFSVPFLDNSEWYLKLQLSQGSPDEDTKTAIVCLCRTDSGPENIEICYSFNESFSTWCAYEQQSFLKNSSSTKTHTITDLCENVDHCLPVDVKVTCRLWQINTVQFTYFPVPVFYSTCTTISIEQRNFYLPINNFSHLSNGLIATIRVDSPADNNAAFICELRKVSFTTLGKTFQLKIIKPNLSPHPTPLVIKYKTQLVDAVKKKHSLVSGQFIFKGDDDHQVTFLVPTSMLEKKNRYMPKDLMILSCEFVVSDNKAFCFTESIEYNSSSNPQLTSPVCGWGVYLDHVYNEHLFLCRLLALLLILFSLTIPYFFPDYSL